MQTIPLAEAWARLEATEPSERLAHWRTLIDWPAPDAPVLWHEGDLALPLLDLAGLGDLALPPQGPVPLLCVHGRLLLDSALLGSAEGRPPVHLLVTGDLQAGDALLGPGLVAVGGALQVQGLLWGQGLQGRLQASGAAQARCALFSQGYQARLPSARIDWWIDTQAQGDAPGADPTGYRAEALAAQLHPEAREGLATLWPAATSTPAPAPLPDASRLLRAPALRARALRAEPLLQPAEALPGLFAPLVPPATATSAIDIAAIRALVDGPLLARRQQRLQDWFGEIDYALCRRHVDASGQPHEDSVFITVWRQWDFFLQAARVPRPRHLGMRLAARLGLHEPPLEDVLTLLWRHPDAEGEGPWSPLDASAPAEAHAACAAAWQAVQAHAAEGLAQARAGLPLWGWMQRQLTPERVQALTELPVFTERYNDWWHSDRNGFWEGDLWVGARQPGLRGAQRSTRALKLSWAQGQPRPEDAEDNHLASYLLEFDTGSDGRPWLRMGGAQRQDSERQPLPHHSAAHLLRLVRLFTAIDTVLHQRDPPPAVARAPARPPARARGAGRRGGLLPRGAGPLASLAGLGAAGRPSPILRCAAQRAAARAQCAPQPRCGPGPAPARTLSLHARTALDADRRAHGGERSRGASARPRGNGPHRRPRARAGASRSQRQCHRHRGGAVVAAERHAAHAPAPPARRGPLGRRALLGPLRRGG
jgi:hypothetical protein